MFQQFGLISVVKDHEDFETCWFFKVYHYEKTNPWHRIAQNLPLSKIFENDNFKFL